MFSGPDPWPAGEWRRRLADAVRDVDELLAMLGIGRRSVGSAPAAAGARRFPLRVPRGFVSRMRPGDPNDPLLRQVLPVVDEDDEVEGFTDDPVGELGLVGDRGLIRKYHGRALVVATGACAVHCRYCFRRHFPYGETTVEAPGLDAALEAITADPAVDEVILSGGDPLILPDEAIARLVAELVALPQIRRLRIHTRMPVVLPERVDESLVEWIRACSKPLVVVIHANHPNEIDDDVVRAMTGLRAVGATLLNQSVLLHGVNDAVEPLAELSRRLADCGVLPYYLHLLDRVAGAAHFDVDEARALELMAELREQLPGYLVPRLVREIDGAPSKVVFG